MGCAPDVLEREEGTEEVEEEMDEVEEEGDLKGEGRGRLDASAPNAYTDSSSRVRINLVSDVRRRRA